MQLFWLCSKSYRKCYEHSIMLFVNKLFLIIYYWSKISTWYEYQNIIFYPSTISTKHSAHVNLLGLLDVYNAHFISRKTTRGPENDLIRPSLHMHYLYEYDNNEWRLTLSINKRLYTNLSKKNIYIHTKSFCDLCQKKKKKTNFGSTKDCSPNISTFIISQSDSTQGSYTTFEAFFVPSPKILEVKKTHKFVNQHFLY